MEEIKQRTRKDIFATVMMNSTESNKRPRAGIISNHQAPYRDATFTCLQRRGVFDIKCITLFDSDYGHKFWDLDEITYSNVTLTKHWGSLRNSCFHHQILSVLRKERFDVIVIPGYQHVTCWLAIIYCMITKTPFIFSLDKIHGRSASRIRSFLVSRAFGFIRRSASAFWVPGKASRQYLCNNGIKNDRIFEGCYNLGFDIVTEQLNNDRKKERLKTRRNFSIDENGFVFLMVANVLPNRRHDLLLESFSQVVAACPNSYLLLVGKGANQQTIRRLSKNTNTSNIRAIGPVTFAALAPLYTASDAYIHSGGEPYSTAVEYAAIAGLPIVTTTDVGAAEDYVIDGETGYVVSLEDVTGFANKMLLLAWDREAAQHLGQNTRKLACKFTSEWAAEQLEKAIAVAYGRNHD
jgi:glycosyltransferase involved in cell wall biosynthesis